MRSIEHLINRQIEQWNLERGSWVPSARMIAPQERPAHPVIAMNPQYGCGSRLVAEILNRSTGYSIYGYRMIDKVAENIGVRRLLVDRFDQRWRSQIRALVEGILRNRHVDHQEYFTHLVQVLKAFIQEGGCILLGRGAPFLVEKGCGIRVRLTAPWAQRIANLRRFNDLSVQEAEERLKQSDRERAEFAEKYFDKDIDNPLEYDLTLNMDRLTPETAAGAILRALDAASHERPAPFYRLSETVSAEELIDRQIEHWESRRELWESDIWEEATKKPLLPQRLPVIAFSRSFGAGARLVSDIIHARLHYEIFGYRIIDQVAVDMNLSRRIMERLDGRARSAIQAVVDSLVERRHVSQEAYFRSLVHVIRALIEQGSVVLLGRGSAFLVEKEEGIRVRLVAPLEKRVENVKAFCGIEDDKTAREKIAQADKNSAGFVRQLFKTEISDPNRYDLVLNMGRLSPADAADILQRVLEPLLVRMTSSDEAGS